MKKQFGVIADDFTGAAEIAGICLRYGLNVVVFTSQVNDSDADVIIVNTDSRSMNREAAKTETEMVVKKLLALQPAWIYKKTDSVLRGYVLDELMIQMELTDFGKVLFIPANPSLGRTIKDGEYFIGDKKITETGFVNDPEFPVADANVLKMIGDTSGKVTVRKYTDDISLPQIVIGEAASNGDIKEWVKQTDESWMLAGAGDFFTAILDQKFQLVEKNVIPPRLPYLYVCGTAFDKSRALIRKIDEQLNCVMYLPETDSDAIEWLSKVFKILEDQNRIIVAIDENKIGAEISALDMRSRMAVTVKRILAQAEIKGLFIEGGSTAAAILEALKINTLIAVSELERGVVSMKSGELVITVKPGSYDLPEKISQLYS